MKKFFREFFDEFRLVLRAIPKGIKNTGMALYKGTPKFFKNLGPNIKRVGVGLTKIFSSPFAVTSASTGATIFKAQMLVKGLLIFSLSAVGLGTAGYVVSNVVVDNSMVTISVGGSENKNNIWDKNEIKKNVGIALSESPDFESSSVTLNCQGIRNLTNISGNSLPGDIESVNGSHNGEHYIAYTFYLRNTGDVACDIKEEMTIKNSVKNVDAAIRIRLYRDGQEVTYAKIGDDGVPEVDTVPFMGKTVFSNTKKQIEPGKTIKYTLVIWLEGDDPQCLDDLKGGAVSMSMTFDIDRQDGS